MIGWYQPPYFQCSNQRLGSSTMRRDFIDIYNTSYSLIQYFWIVTIVLINQPQCNNMLGVNLESIPYILHALTINARVHRVHWFVEPYFSKIENNILRMFDNMIYHSNSHSNREHDDQTMIKWWLMVINEICCVPNMFRPSMVRCQQSYIATPHLHGNSLDGT